VIPRAPNVAPTVTSAPRFWGCSLRVGAALDAANARRPDWKSPAFWLWAIRTCNAKPVILHDWFPCVTAGTWTARKRWAATHLGIEFPVCPHSSARGTPDPPGDWPREGATHVTEAGTRDGYRETIETKADGTCISDRLLALELERCKDPAYLLDSHGFDPESWDLVAARNNVWNVYSKGDDGHDVSTLYASRITVRPRVPVLDLAALVEALRAVGPVEVEPGPPSGDRLLELDLFDMHWGVAYADHYRPTLARILRLIESTDARELLLPIGSDWFHNDDFRSRTAKGTQIDGMDFVRAWRDALAFVATIVTAALERGIAVRVVYVKGNHDESMSWAFVQLVKERFPQVDVEDSIQERKLHLYERVAIGLTHGDKATKDLDRLFLAEFPEFAAAAVKEIHGGHIHHEVTNDRYGVMVRRLPTAGKIDQWSRDRGYVGVCRRFAAFVYAPDALESIAYV